MPTTWDKGFSILLLFPSSSTIYFYCYFRSNFVITLSYNLHITLNLSYFKFYLFFMDWTMAFQIFSTSLSFIPSCHYITAIKVVHSAGQCGTLSYIILCFFWLYRVLAAVLGIFVAACGIFCCNERALRCGTWASL